MSDLIQWVVLGAGSLFLLGALLVLLVVVVVKLRGGKASGAATAAKSYVGLTLRQRMEREDREEAEQVLNALYLTRDYTERQAERDAKMKAIVAGLVPAGTPAPN